MDGYYDIRFLNLLLGLQLQSCHILFVIDTNSHGWASHGIHTITFAVISKIIASKKPMLKSFVHTAAFVSP